MTEIEIQRIREAAWDCGWNAAIDCASMLLSSPLVREDVTRHEVAKELQGMRVGAKT